MNDSPLYGWHGQLLNVDLSRQKIWVEKIAPELLQEYLGGRGLGVRLMRRHHQEDCFAATMPLIFAVGPLCGSGAPTAARLSVVSRSPLTGTIFDSSCGGSFAWQLKAAGYDALKIVGQSLQPVVLDISAAAVQLLPAQKLWGCGVAETVAAFAGSGSMAVIGVAGENLVRYANIMTSEGSAAGRGGLGAVMGAKKLKGIRVAGDRMTAIADPERLQRGVKDVMRLFNASPVIFGSLGFSEYGTAALVDLLAQRRMVPTENFRTTCFSGTGRYSGPALRKAYQPKKQGCHDCPVACKKITADGGLIPGHDSLSHFGALLGISDQSAIVAACRQCNELGMDTISAAATMAAWSEVRGVFPTAAQLPELLEIAARRQGVGDLLAEGAQRLTSAMGKPHLAMTVKGLELPAYDPRGAYGTALAYCTSNRGACHLRAFPISHEILRKPVATDRFDFAGKAWMNIVSENCYAVVDSLVACRFAFLGAGLEEYAELLNAVTGLDYSPAQLTSMGQRIYLTERLYNQNNGFTAQDDMLPERFFTEDGSSGEGIIIAAIDRNRFIQERQRYYRLRGLDDQGRLLQENYLESQP